MRISTDLPAPTVNATFLYLVDGYAGGVTAFSSRTVEQGGFAYSADFNQNAYHLDINSQYGGGFQGVVHGLTLSIGTGLNVNFSAGGAVIKNVVQKKAPFSVLVSASITNGYIWLHSNGATEVVNNSITKPSGDCIFIGSFTSGASTITSVDTGGVVYLKNSIPERTVGDTGAPADSPSSTWRGWTKTSDGDYWWNGTEYLRFGKFVEIRKFTVTHTQLQTGATTNNIEIWSAPAGLVVHNCKIKHSVAFAGTSISAYTISVGITGNLTKYAGAFDVFQAVSGTAQQFSTPDAMESSASATSVKVQAISTGANLSASTAGSVDIWLWVSRT